MELSKRVRNSNGGHSHQINVWHGDVNQPTENLASGLLGLVAIFQGDVLKAADETIMLVFWLPTAQTWQIIVTDTNVYADDPPELT